MALSPSEELELIQIEKVRRERSVLNSVDASKGAAAESVSGAVSGAVRPPSVMEAMVAGPANILPGLVPATRFVAKHGIQTAKDNPSSVSDALKFVLPAAAGLATGGVGFFPAVGMAGLMGAGAEGYGQVARRALGDETVPQTVAEQAKAMGVEGAKQAAYEAGGRGIFSLGKKLVSGLRGWAAGKAAKISEGATKSELSRIYGQHPEVMEPGYFNERVDTFANDLPGKVKAIKDKAGEAINKALEASKATPAMKVSQLESVVDTEVEKLGLAANTKEFRNVLAEIKRMEKALINRGEAVSFKDLMDFERSLYSVTKGQNVPPIAKKAATAIRARLDEAYKVAPKLQAARTAYSKASEAEDVIEEAFGVSSDVKRADIGSTDRVASGLQRFLAKSDPYKDRVKEALDQLPGKVTERAEKLAAAGGGAGRLTGDQPVLPTMGAGNVGYVMQNPAAGAGALGVTAATRAVSSPYIVRNLFKASQGLKAVLPGAKYLPAVGRAVETVLKADKKKKR